MSTIIAVDIGGTFTDLAVYDGDAEQLVYAKDSTTYDDLTRGVVNSLTRTNVALSEARLFKHGTTLVINTLIQRNGADVVLVVNQGFKDVIEIGRGNKADPFNLRYRRDPPLIARDRRFEINERMSPSGEVITAPDRAEVEELAEKIKAIRTQAIAISFINAYANPANERLVAEWLAELLPGVYLTYGSDVSREWYEYERTATVAANAYVGPQMTSYVNRLDQNLRGNGFNGEFFLMGSNGGVLSIDRTVRQPVLLVESGPVGGCIGAVAYAEQLGLDSVVAFDMGGTTAKSALVTAGSFDVKSEYYVGGYEQGFPIRAAVVDVVEVGAGGGSIAWLDDQKRLHVGPRSAGSEPGPVAYAQGGTEPTVTDANVVLGRLDPQSFLGGDLKLDADGARAAIADRVAAPLGYRDDQDVLKVAEGIVAIAVVTMAASIKKITVERGIDPRTFALFAYGGGGPLHAAALARELQIPLVLVPPEPGNFSAIGMLLADIRLDDAQTFLQPLGEAAIVKMEALYAELETMVAARLAREIGDSPIVFERAAEMRYRGQAHSVKTPIGVKQTAAQIAQVYEDVYRARFGHADAEVPVEFVNLQVTARAATARPKLEMIGFTDRAVAADTNLASRPVFFKEANTALPTAVFQRPALPAGFAAAGPAIIEEYGSTTLIGPNDRFEIGSLGEIRIHVRLS